MDENSEIWYLAGLAYSNLDPEEAKDYLLKCKELIVKENCTDPEFLEKVASCLTIVEQKISQLEPKTITEENEEDMETDDEE